MKFFKVFRQRVEISMEKYLYLIRLEERVKIANEKLKQQKQQEKDYIDTDSILRILEMENENG